VGGAAMWRFVRAYLPECAPTLVDSDETIIALARRWFYLNQPVVHDTAQRFLAGTTTQFDVILVDLYGPAGPADSNEMFWIRRLERPAPGRSLARHWGDFCRHPDRRAVAEAARRGRSRSRAGADLCDPPRLPRQSRAIRGDRRGNRARSARWRARALCR